MAFQLSLKPETLIKLRRIRPLSSSTPPDSSADISSAAISDPSSAAAPPPSFDSHLRDIKDRLRSPPPRRIPDVPLPPPRPTGAPASAPAPAPASSLVDICKHLAEFPNSSRSPSSSPPTLSFKDLFKKIHLDKPSAAAAAADDDDDPKRTAHPFDSIRESLRKFTDVQPPKPSFCGRDYLASGFTQEKSTDDTKPKAPKTEFLPMYSYKELEEKLRRIRPDVGDNWFSIAELNDQLVKLYELEEKELDSMMGREDCRVLRESLLRVTEADLKKKAAASLDRLSAIMSKHPQDELLETFKKLEMKLEFQKVREEFKMSVSDCGSTRVQEVGNKPSSQSVLNAILTDEKSTDDANAKDPKTEFLPMYSYKKLEEKLRRIRPEVGDNWFSIAELNDQLVKLYELEEKKLDSMMGGEDCCGPPGKPLEGHGG